MKKIGLWIIGILIVIYIGYGVVLTSFSVNVTAKEQCYNETFECYRKCGTEKNRRNCLLFKQGYWKGIFLWGYSFVEAKIKDISNNEEFSEYGLLQWPNGTITLEDFEKEGNIIKESEGDNWTGGKICSETPETACVPVILKENEILVTPHEYNEFIAEETDLPLLEEPYYTDLKTFRKVTGLKEASPEYVEGELPGTYIFDAYTKFYKTKEEREAMLKEKIDNQTIEEPVIEEVNIPTFEELNNVVDKCDDDSYDYNVYQKAYILPYKDGYIGYQLGGQDGWELYLTYRKLGDPCNIIAQSDNIFWWNPYYKEGQETFRGASYPDNKIYIAQGLFSGVPTEKIAKELNCESGKNFEDHDHTCMKEADKYFYDLMVGNEENEYFTQWMNKLKEDIDNEDYKTFSYYREEYDTCSQKVVDLIGTIQPNQDEKARGEYQVKRTENMHKCVLENLNN